MKSKIRILLIVLLGIISIEAYSQKNTAVFDFYGTAVLLPDNYKTLVDFRGQPTTEGINKFYEQLDASAYSAVAESLIAYKEKNNPDDWLYYQLVRKAAQLTSPKAENYFRYTLYKWYLLTKSGYNATICLVDDRMYFYVQCDENIYDIPCYTYNNNKYVCLNYHDYQDEGDITEKVFERVSISIPGAERSFSYKVTHLPNFTPDDYIMKDISFQYYHVSYKFEVKVNKQVKNIFANYPTTDYKMYFNTPLSKETYSSLIPQLKEKMKGMNVKNGVDYLMRFTRTAFAYQPDAESYGKEKRLSPEQTLLYDYSDCEDRAALFFCLVKEIYNLPMIVLAYPKHLTVAVQFDKPVGKPIIYNGKKYSICEATPQEEDLSIGQLSYKIKKYDYDVAYVYNP